MSEDITPNHEELPSAEVLLEEVVHAELPYTVIKDEPARGGQIVQDNATGSVYFLPYPAV